MTSKAIYRGGRLIQNAEVTPIYVGSATGSPGAGDWATDPMLQQLICKVNRFLDDILVSAYWDQLAHWGSPNRQYSIGPGRRMLHVIAPFNFATQTFDPQKFLKASFDSGLLPGANTNSVYLLYIPPGISGFDQRDEPNFTNNQGQDIVYATVAYTNFDGTPPGANGFDFITYWTTHVLTEMVTDPDNDTGWIVDWEGGGPYLPIASGDCEGVTASFHGYVVARIFNQQTSGCFAPPDDGLAKKPPQAAISVKPGPDTCQPAPVEGTTAYFTAGLTNSNSVIVGYLWNVIGATYSGSRTNRVFSVQVPVAGNQFTVSVQITDAEGCVNSAIRVFIALPYQQAALAELLCKLRHELKVNWWVNPLWDPLRDYTTLTFDKTDLARIESNFEHLSQLVGQLRNQLNLQGGD